MLRGEVRKKGESLADWGLALTVMPGAVVGALVGAVLGSGAGTAVPLVCGTLGTMLGSGLAAGVWLLLVRVWGWFTATETGSDRGAWDRTGEPTAVPTESARTGW
jgi:hypothetical protein